MQEINTNCINDELYQLSFNYYDHSKVKSDGTIYSGNILQFISFVRSRLLDISYNDDKKDWAPSQFYSNHRSEWDNSVQFCFIDIDTTTGADLLFVDLRDQFLKTFKNVVYMQKSWSGKIHICMYVKTAKWDEKTWEERCIFWTGYVNEWCSKIMGINYLEILTKLGKPVLDNSMLKISQPFKISDNDLIINPYFQTKAASNGSSSSKEELIKDTGITYSDIVNSYSDYLKVPEYSKSTQSILDYSTNLSFNIGKAPNRKYRVSNNTRLFMVSALVECGMTDDEIYKLMMDRTESANGGDTHNAKEIKKQIAACRKTREHNNEKHKIYVNIGLNVLSKINVIYQTELDTKNVKPIEVKGETIHLADNEYISQNHLNTLYDYIQDNNSLIVEAPTGSGKTEAAKRLTDKMAKEGSLSVIVTNTCALSGEYGKDKSVIKVENLSTYMEEGKTYSMVFDKFVQYFSHIKRKKLFVIVDEVHTVTENMTFRSVCIELADIMDEIKELDNIKLVMMSATPDYLTVNKFEGIAKQVTFSRNDTRQFTFKLVGGLDLKQVIAKAKKNDWADHICIFSDMGVGMDHTRAISGEEKPARDLWHGVSFGTSNQKYSGYYVSKRNDNWKDITMIDELVQSEKLTPKICMCTSAVFAGTNVKNEHEKFLIVIDYSEFVSTADVRQILGRFRSNTNEYQVIILVNDKKWADWRDFGGINMYLSHNEALPEIEFISTTSEIRNITECQDAFNVLMSMNNAYKHSSVNSIVFDYFMSEHMAKTADGQWIVSYSKLLSALKSYQGRILFGSDITADGTVAIKDDTLNIARFIDYYLKECEYDIAKILDNCQQRQYVKKEAAPHKKAEKKYVDVSIDLTTNRTQDVSTWFDSSTAAEDLSTYVKSDHLHFKNVFEDKIGYVKDFIVHGSDDIFSFRMAFAEMSKKCPEIYIFFKKCDDRFERTEDFDIDLEYENFRESDWNSIIGIYSNADKTLRDILYNDKILSPHRREIIDIWRVKTERTAQSFIKHMRYTFGAYKISESEYTSYTAQIEKNIDIHNIRKSKAQTKAEKDSILSDIREEMKALEQMADGREMLGTSVSALSARIKADYVTIEDLIKEGNKKGGLSGSTKDKSTAGKKGKSLSVVAVYNDGHSVKIEADTYSEMFDKIKELCGGVIYGVTDRFVKDWIAGRNDKLFCCKALGIARFEKCTPEGSLD